MDLQVNRWLRVQAGVLLAVAVGLAGCAAKEEPMDGLTWQDAKRETQAMELRIAALIPKDQVVSIEQLSEGSLFGCGNERHQWMGRTTVVLSPSADDAAIVEQIRRHFEDAGTYTVESYTGVSEDVNVQLTAADGEETFIVGPGIAEGSIEIDSGSACFTLPEGTYPGGDF